MEKRGRVLDMGIGGGGAYTQRNAPNSLRIGLDIYPERMRLLHKDIPKLIADASGKQALPFPAGCFGRIDIIMPHETLLIGLCRSAFLWQELGRILGQKGCVTIVTDISMLGSVSMLDGDKIVDIPRPDLIMWSMAENNGFTAKIEELTSEETQAYGTWFTTKIASNRTGSIFDTVVFRLTITKKGTSA